MRIVFMGTPEFAVPSFNALVDNGYEVVAAFTQPDRPSGRGNKLTACPVKAAAQAKGVPVYQFERIRRKEGREALEALKPDLFVTAAFGQILSQRLLDIPPMGTVNVHASLLPKYRGAAPINWCIAMGEKVAGVTTMFTDAGVDTGDMALKAETPIGELETAGELTERLAEIGANLLIETLKKLEEGTLVRIPQDHENMTYDPMLTKEMGVIDWSQSAADIVNRIHGLNPWPGCSTAVEGGRLKLLRAEVAQGAGQPGEIIVADPKQGLAIAAGEGAVRINQLQAPGGKPMNSKDYLRGHPMAVGTVLKEEISNV